MLEIEIITLGIKLVILGSSLQEDLIEYIQYKSFSWKYMKILLSYSILFPILI